MNRLKSVFNRFRDWLFTIDDPYILPYKYRRNKNYYSYMKMGFGVFDLIRVHTKNQYKDQLDVLDIGCGDGRVALAFNNQSPNLNYTGMDINKKWVELLDNSYRGRSNFSFVHSNIYNLMYNPDGADKAVNYIFPFEEKKFDLIILNSVFTHMRPPEIIHYLSEIQRLLKDDGICWCTFMILTENHDQNFPYAQTKHKFDMGEFKTSDKDIPEINIAFDESRLKSMIEPYFNIDKTIYGWWRNMKEVKFDLNIHKQDVLILKKHSKSV